MSDTRSTIMDAIEVRLKTILKANGYHTDLGNSVWQWREAPLQKTELPAALLREDADYVGETLAAQGHVLRVTITVIVSDGEDTMQRLREAVADVRAAIYTDETWSGSAWFTNLVESRGEISHDEYLFAAESLSFEVYYETTLSGA